jgi:hypothetical protein
MVTIDILITLRSFRKAQKHDRRAENSSRA